MKSDVAALEGILGFLLKSKPNKKKEPQKNATKQVEEKEDKEEKEEKEVKEVKGKTVMMSLGQLGRKKLKEDTKEKTFFKKKKRKR